MDGLSEYAPAIVGLGFVAYVAFTYFRIKREQVRSRESKAAE